MTLALALLASACVPPLDDLDPSTPQPLDVGQTREITLRSLRLDVTGFQERVDLPRLQTLPPEVLERIWLLDLDLTPLTRNALEQLTRTSERDARSLPQTAQNMRRLLLTSADNVSLDGTSLAELVGVAAAIGIPPARALADLLQTSPTEPILPLDAVTEVVVDQVLNTHPATLRRPGPINDDHPDGWWDVAPRSIPITLADVVRGFDNLAERFGPAPLDDGRTHPGFIDAASGVTVLEDAFALTVQVDVNALPWRGLALPTVSDAAVNSTRAQIDTLFPVDREGWLALEGLVETPAILDLTLRVNEDDRFHAGGDRRAPLPRGNGSAWDLDPWLFEHVLAEASHQALSGRDETCVVYTLGTGVEAFRGCVDPTGWATFQTFAGLGDPPEPIYLWDLVSEIGQVRLHDGGLEEGEAHISFTLEEVPLGISGQELSDEVARNLGADPRVLDELAAILTENSQGAADLFYVREGETTDTLWFVAPIDLPITGDGPSRTYDYNRPGFFFDPDLTQIASTPRPDTGHERVEVTPGDQLYVEDASGQRYRLSIGDKPSDRRLRLAVERIR